MSVFIGRDQQWHQHERRTFRCSITDGQGNPVSLEGVQLNFQLRRSNRSGTVLFKRLAAEFLPPEGTPTPNIAVWEISSAESGQLEDGWMWGQLLDDSNDDVLAVGGVILLPGYPAAVS